MEYVYVRNAVVGEAYPQAAVADAAAQTGGAVRLYLLDNRTGTQKGGWPEELVSSPVDYGEGEALEYPALTTHYHPGYPVFEFGNPEGNAVGFAGKQFGLHSADQHAEVFYQRGREGAAYDPGGLAGADFNRLEGRHYRHRLWQGLLFAAARGQPEGCPEHDKEGYAFQNSSHLAMQLPQMSVP